MSTLSPIKRFFLAIRKLLMFPVSKSLIVESSFALSLGLLGVTLAGALFEHVVSWAEFREVPRLFVMIPIILNMKGNLEMNLAMRLSEASKSGLLRSRSTFGKVILSNLVLLQTQTVVISVLAGTLAFALGALGYHHPHKDLQDSGDVQVLGSWMTLLVLLASAMITTSAAAGILGSFMCGVVLVSEKLRLDPDNIMTPVAASLGDLTCLSILVNVARVVLSWKDTIVPYIIIGVYLALLPLLWSLVYRLAISDSVKASLRSDWLPLLIAAFISSISGIFLKSSLRSFQELAILTTVVNGVVGNLSCISTSRCTSELKKNSEAQYLELQEPFQLDDDDDSDLDISVATVPGMSPTKPRKSIRPTVPHPAPVVQARKAMVGVQRTLYLLNFPIVTAFVLVSLLFGIVDSEGRSWVGWLYVVTPISAALVLTIAKYGTRLLYERSLDPVHYAMPLMTSLTDVIGSSLLFTTWRLAYGR